MFTSRGPGIGPGLAEPESAVLPLDDPREVNTWIKNLLNVSPSSRRRQDKLDSPAEVPTSRRDVSGRSPSYVLESLQIQKF